MARRTKVIVGVVALTIVIGIVAVVALRSAGGGTEVESAEVEKRDLAVTIAASGRVESGVRADVYPPTAGTLEKLFVVDGESVMAGAPLAQMDTAPLEAQVAAAEAAVKTAESQSAAVNKQAPSSADVAAARANTDAAWAGYQAALASADAASGQGPTAGDIAAAQAATNAAYTAYTNADAAYNALKRSIETSPVPSPEAIARLAELDAARDQAYAAYLQARNAEAQLRAYDGTATQAQADAAADQAYAAYLAARAQQSQIEGTNLSAENAAAQAGVDQARANLVIAQDTLEKATLVAPVDGVVLFNSAGVPGGDGSAPQPGAGSTVSPQAPPFTVVDLDGLRFLAEVDEVDVESIELGMDGLVSLDAFPERGIETTVSEIMPAATLTQTGGTVFPVYLRLSDTEENILIGMKGDVEIRVRSVPDALTVPIEALFDEGGTSYVYAIQDGRLIRTQVEIGTLTETDVQIVSGVEEGDTVALSGPTELVDGMAVETGE